MKIAVVGAGAAGLLAACRLSDAGASVTLFEHSDRPGRKLSITGKGRCNLTNDSDMQTILSSIPTGGRFLYSAMSYFPPEEVKNYFENDLGVPLKTERGNRVFPVSDKASDVVGALTRRLEKNGVKTVHAKVTAIAAKNGVVQSVVTAKGSVPFDVVLLCTGGRSYPATGSDGSGYAIARALGHSVTPLRPSLVPLECTGGICEAMQGLSLKNVALSVFDRKKGKDVEPMLSAYTEINDEFKEDILTQNE